MKRKINIYNLHTHIGQTKAGVEFGPDYLKELGLIGRLIDLGYEVSTFDLYDTYDFNKFNSLITMKNNLEKILDLKDEALQLFIGGDHSLSFSSLSSLKLDENSVVIWLDAHADMNTVSTSPTGSLHGMPLAYAMGYGEENDILGIFDKKIKSDNVFLIGQRAIDKQERALIDSSGVHFYGAEIIEKNPKWLEECLSEISTRARKVHLSFDIDSLDSTLVPGTGTPVENGLSETTVLDFIQKLKDRVRITSMDFVEINPYLDMKDKRTGKQAMRIIEEILK
ncbi:arginase family protein [Vagococcus elongatus]|uniref:Arginase n=1 Tax=Vagococcus elongatus TaxID=180344 RepID=A0A430B5M6_9ENTE|nr:arginase family protein [Vagococcus elongatus]RSU15608.1 hypothetical protein CBF29_00600 [Vagococcus elongatus]